MLAIPEFVPNALLVTYPRSADTVVGIDQKERKQTQDGQAGGQTQQEDHPLGEPRRSRAMRGPKARTSRTAHMAALRWLEYMRITPSAKMWSVCCGRIISEHKQKGQLAPKCFQTTLKPFIIHGCQNLGRWGRWLF